MPNPDIFRTDPSEALALRLHDAGTHSTLPDLRRWELEFTSRGDRVPGRLLLPPEANGAAPYPLILLQHGAGGSKDAPYLDAAAGPWVRAGAAALSVDFPLHGDRISPKMSEQLLEILATPRHNNDGLSSFLWEEFVRQSVIDLQNTLRAAGEIPELDCERIVFASFSLGSILGAIFCSIDPRPRAAALAIGGGGFGPSELDPSNYISDFAPRPLLCLGAEQDARVPRCRTEHLFDAALQPKEIAWYDVEHGDLPGLAFKRMWEFLRPHLELDGTR